MAFRSRKEAPVLRDGVVTSLVPGRNRGERVVVYLDERRAFDLALTVADGAGLRAGVDLSAERQQALIEQDAPYRARERAVSLLGLRDRSRRELETRLRQAGFEPEVIARSVEWLLSLGYLDDRRFARAYATEKGRTGWGPRRIRSELAAKGVERSIVDEVLGEGETAGAEDAHSGRGGGAAGVGQADGALEQTVRKRFGREFASDPRGAERRLAGFLARRGYDWETIGRMSRLLKLEAGAADGSEGGSDEGLDGALGGGLEDG
jgi:SOS response regulatory protein OraA/RecX